MRWLKKRRKTKQRKNKERIIIEEKTFNACVFHVRTRVLLPERADILDRDCEGVNE